MANPTCTPDALVTGAKCFKNFDASSRLSLLILFRVLELASIGGTNYNGQMGNNGTLENDSKCYKNLAMDNPTLSPSIYELAIASAAATTAGAAVPSTTTALAAAIACNKNFSLAEKGAQLLNLLCKLGVHKAYPQ